MAGVLEHGERLPAVVDQHGVAASFAQVNAGSGRRAVRKKPSFSLIWAKWSTGGVRPFSSGPKPCEVPTGRTCTVPRARRRSPSAGRRDRVPRLEALLLQEAAAMVAISGE